MSREAVPPENVEAALIEPRAARLPVPLRAPPVRLSGPPATRVVPAAIEVVARRSTPLRVWLPLIVPPAKTTVLAAGSRVPPR